jgi:hypothetical protein
VLALLAADSDFYDDVMREIVFALGAALFVGSAFALWKRRADAAAATKRTVANSRPGSPVRGYGRGESEDLPQAPVARTVTYMVIGFIVMIAGLGAILNK